MRRPLIPGLVMEDSWLTPFTKEILNRQRLYDLRLKEIVKHYGCLEACSRQTETMGIHFDEKSQEWVYREWAPSAKGLWFIGDFNGWNRESTPLIPTLGGVWEVRLPKEMLKHGQLVKVHIWGADDSHLDRVPAMATRVVQNPVSYDFSAQIWAPESKYVWKNQKFDPASIKVPFIYEAHTGMCGEEERVHTYREFADEILPRIAKNGYNVVQLMAVQEHPYYGSFGYHVSSFFAASSRFGTPEDLKYLVDKAHGLKIAVLLDVVHSHAVKNVAEGLNNFDGSGGLYFKSGAAGNHPDWDSKCFDYGRESVLSFLLSNVRWWLEEYQFDGFRFDGVTSMLYHHHGHAVFSGYESYFGPSVDTEAVTYLQLANTLIQEIKPGAFSIAEDMSGMPGLCRPIDEGGVGFTHRLAMGIPDYWIKLIKEKSDEDWSMGDLWHTMINRRYGEPHVAYAESHDQALVGDKTLSFRLMDAEMYTNMSKNQSSLLIDRGIALHKMIRFISLTAGGEGWLNFMGNEFGHPEWIDFPREGNHNSFKYCRRQWSLVDNSLLKYSWLGAFDRSLVMWAKKSDLLLAPSSDLLHIDEINKILAYQRGGKMFVFNWSPSQALSDYAIMAPCAGRWRVVLDTDQSEFGGYDRIDHKVVHFTKKDSNLLSLYLVPRVALVLEKLPE